MNSDIIRTIYVILSAFHIIIWNKRLMVYNQNKIWMFTCSIYYEELKHGMKNPNAKTSLLIFYEEKKFF